MIKPILTFLSILAIIVLMIFGVLFNNSILLVFLISIYSIMFLFSLWGLTMSIFNKDFLGKDK